MSLLFLLGAVPEQLDDAKDIGVGGATRKGVLPLFFYHPKHAFQAREQNPPQTKTPTAQYTWFPYKPRAGLPRHPSPP